jgi:3-keto-5-aminohexanoate cleavage enzyme
VRDHVPPPLRPYDPLIINLALTGVVPVRPQVPHVPVTAADIVATAARCHELGATIVHLHARATDQRAEWRRSAYQPILATLREQCPELVLVVSTSGRRFPAFEERADVLRLRGDAKPDMASLTLGSMNFAAEPSVNSPEMIKRLAETMAEAEIKPELEIFDTGMAYLAADLLDRGVLHAPLYANVLLGSLGTAPARAAELAHIVTLLPPGTVWAAAGIGAFQLPITGIATFMGGHVRTGLEDNPYLDYRTRAPATNEQLVARARGLAAAAQRELATPAWTRSALGLRAYAGASQTVDGK